MKVLLINGSHRKKNTYGLLLQIEKILKTKSIETEILNLFDYEVKDCIGCEVCVKKISCHINDSMPHILQKINESDGVIFSSPVYLNGVTSKIKTFTDRTNLYVHKPLFAGIPVLFVSTTASTGLKDVEKFFNSYSNCIGARYGGFIKRKVPALSKSIHESELKKFLKLLNEPKAKYRPAIPEIIMFNVGKVMAEKSSGNDAQYWKEQNLLDKRYYFPCKINLFKKCFGKFIHGVLKKAIK